MIKKTRFYYELLEARADEVALVKVIDKVMPLIDKHSKINKQVDEDLKSFLIEYVIRTIKAEGFAENLLKD